MAKINCWEHKKCGRQRGGDRINELGMCPSVENRVNGIHGGANGGRCCCAIAGTLYGDKVQGTYVLMHRNYQVAWIVISSDL